MVETAGRHGLGVRCVWLDTPLAADASSRRQKPAWSPGTRRGYHTMSLGLHFQELIRHVDPAHRSLGRFFHEELAVPLGLEFYIGLPPAIPDERLATVKTLSIARGLLALPRTPRAMLIGGCTGRSRS